MWFEDLTPCTYFSVTVHLVAIAWLERGKEYSKGKVDRAIYDALVNMQNDPWQPVASAGAHECDLCQFVGEARGQSNLFIPSRGTIYVAPELIVHYINTHGYAPPQEFCRAVLECPPMRSMEYLKLICACSGTSLLRS